MNFKDLVGRYPEVVRDRHSLSFTRESRSEEITTAFSHFGVVMLKKALPGAMLATCGEAFRKFAQGAGTQGSWHPPWAVSDGERFPAATVLSAVIGAWAWNVVEDLCGSSQIVVLLKWCTARHSIDTLLGVGGHQDAKVVAGEVPFSLWIPLGPVEPGANSGLGFVVPAPNALLPTLPHDDIGADYVLSDPARLWIPSYAVGDLTIHSRFSPHFTTGYGTLSDRFSIEIRAMARRSAPPEYVDPALYVARRNGIPTIVESSQTARQTAENRFMLSFSRNVARR